MNERMVLEDNFRNKTVNQLITELIDNFYDEFDNEHVNFNLTYIKILFENKVELVDDLFNGISKEVNNIVEYEKYFLIKQIDINLYYEIDKDVNISDLNIPNDLITEYTYIVKYITANYIKFSKNQTYRNIGKKSVNKYVYNTEPKSYNGCVYYSCVNHNPIIEEDSNERNIDIIYGDSMFINENFIQNITPNNEYYPLINLIDSSLPYKPASKLEDKLKLLNDEVEKEDMKYIIDLYKDMRNTKFTKPVVNIIKAYIANISENVLFQLQNELKEINEVLTGEEWGLNSYIYNLE